MNSSGAYVASAAIVRVPLDFTELGSSPWTFGSTDSLTPGAAVRAVLVVLLEPPPPQPAAMPAVASAPTSAMPIVVLVPLIMLPFVSFQAETGRREHTP